MRLAASRSFHGAAFANEASVFGLLNPQVALLVGRSLDMSTPFVSESALSNGHANGHAAENLETVAREQVATDAAQQARSVHSERNGHDSFSSESDAITTLLHRLRTREASVGVVGLGYVGAPLALAFAGAGYRVTGLDVATHVVDDFERGQTRSNTDPSQVLALRDAGMLRATVNWDELCECDALLICVPTPLSPAREPDLSFIVAAAREIAARLRPGQLVVLESTTYPGTTEEVVQPILEEGGLVAGDDFALAFSPERIDPGNLEFPLGRVPKVVGGGTERCLEAALLLYGAICQTVPVSSARAAEMTKLLENVFRSVNIALVNELAVLCDRMKLDVWEIIDAARTKPYGFTAFYPGPGLGGHCIPIDPFYLAWKAREYGFETRFIELAGQVNRDMPLYVVERTARALNDERKPLNGSRIGLLGVSYKPDVGDCRESPALEIAHLLRERGSEIVYHDTHVASIRVGKEEFSSQPIESLYDCDCLLLLTHHRDLPYADIARHARLILDTRNAFAKFSDAGVRIVKL